MPTYSAETVLEEAVLAGELLQRRDRRVADPLVDFVQGIDRLGHAGCAAFVDDRLGIGRAVRWEDEDGREACDTVASADRDVVFAVDGGEDHLVAEDVRELFPERLERLGESRVPRSRDSLPW